MSPGPQWLLASGLLVLLATIPGIIVFYKSLVPGASASARPSEVVRILLAIAALWLVLGGGSVGLKSFVFLVYHLGFVATAVCLLIAPLLGKVPGPVLLRFAGGWTALVYVPLSSMLWGTNGFMNGAGNAHAAIRAVDFSGGILLQVSSGVAGLILWRLAGEHSASTEAVPVGKKLFACVLGQSLLCVGWFGFAGGHAAEVSRMAQAFTNIILAVFISSGCWAMADQAIVGKPTSARFLLGAIAGIAAISSGAGYVSATGAVMIGLAAGLVPALIRISLAAPCSDPVVHIFATHILAGVSGVIITGVLAGTGASWEPQVEALSISILFTAGVSFLLATTVQRKRMDSFRFATLPEVAASTR